LHFLCRRVRLDALLVLLEDILYAETFLGEQLFDSPDKRNNNRKKMLDKIVMTCQSRREFIAKDKIVATTILNKHP
jgi:hypothetical protein